MENPNVDLTQFHPKLIYTTLLLTGPYDLLYLVPLESTNYAKAFVVIAVGSDDFYEFINRYPEYSLYYLRKMRTVWNNNNVGDTEIVWHQIVMHILNISLKITKKKTSVDSGIRG